MRDLTLETVQDEALDAAVEAAALVAQRSGQQHQAVRLELEQARCQAQLAQRRYESVDPEQRLVAAELEKRWNTALERVAKMESQVQSLECSEPTSTLDRNQLSALAQGVEAVWELADSMELKQRIARLLIQEIVADTDDDKREVILLVHWVGGRHTELRVTRPRVGEHGNATS